MVKKVKKKKIKTLATESADIKGLPWKISVQVDKEYDQDHGNDSDGITYASTNHMYIKRDAFNVETILHELGHAYYHSCLVYTTGGLDNDDVEEIFCEIIAIHGPQLVQQARNLYRQLKNSLPEDEQ